MTLEIGLTLGILIIAIYLFITEKIRMDVVALLVLVSLTVLGLVTPEEAMSGFSNSAVVTVWAVFILSGALSRTGVASLLGAQIIRVAGSGEVRLIILIMLTSAVMSAFMNNVGVVALMLPVVVSIARRTGISPSRLLMPLLIASMLGGMTTLISTPPNIIASEALQKAGLGGFNLFDFTPVGGIIVLAGVVFMVLIGRHLLPKPKLSEGQGKTYAEIERAYMMTERLAKVRIPEGSPMIGKTISETRFSSALGITVLDVRREGNKRFVPQANTRLQSGDLLTVAGRLDFYDEMKGREYLTVEADDITLSKLVTAEIGLYELILMPNTNLIGGTLRQLNFRHRFGVIVLAVCRDGQELLSDFDRLSLLPGDALLVQGRREQVKALGDRPEFKLVEGNGLDYHLEAKLQAVSVPDGSPLVGRTLVESHLSEYAGLSVLGLLRQSELHLMVDPNQTVLQAGDLMYVKGNVKENLEALVDLQTLLIESRELPSLQEIETDETAMLELLLSPHSNLPGRSLGQIEFRSRYDVSVIAVFREGRAYRSNLSGIQLRYGDALLVHGRRDKLRLIAKDPDFLSLADDIQPSPRLAKAPLAVLIMLGVIVTVLLEWLPISVAAVGGAMMMVLAGCLTMDEAYREIEWRAVFLIAGMMPLGIAMDSSGTAEMLANAVISTAAVLGTLPMFAGLFLMTVAATQVMPNAVVVVLLAPISLAASANLDLSPHAVMMVIAMGASMSFMTPVGHPANLLVMAPGGYQFKDYVRVGLLFLFIFTLIILFVLPLFWPL